MRKRYRLSLAIAVMLAVIAGGLTVALSGPRGSNVDRDIDARRTQLDQRISEGRHSGQLRGLAYMGLLDEQHRVLVKQRRAEAQGMTPEARRELMADMDRVSANLDKRLGK